MSLDPKPSAPTVRPILMSGPMVRAILDGKKTQTRRVVKSPFDLTDLLNPEYARRVRVVEGGIQCDWLGGVTSIPLPCPFGAVGGRLWVRETWRAPDACECKETCHTPGHIYYEANDDGYQNARFNRLRPSIHMPRWASRLTLEITDVRVERLHAITEDDAKAEGVDAVSIADVPRQATTTRRGDFAQLWNGLNAKRGYGWDVNPWVWVISFKRVAGCLSGGSLR